MNRKDFLIASGLEGTTLEIWLEQRWIIPGEAGPDPLFSETDLARARLIHELQHDMGANDAGIDIILHLMDQLHTLRRVLGHMRDQFGPLDPTADTADRPAPSGAKPKTTGDG